MAQHRNLAISIVRHLMQEAEQTLESLDLHNPNDLAAHIAKKFGLTRSMLASEPAPGIPLLTLWDECAHRYPLSFTSSERLAMSIANFIDDIFGAVKANPLATPYHPLPDAAAFVVHTYKLWHFRDDFGNDALQARVVPSLLKIWQHRFEMLCNPAKRYLSDRDSSPSPAVIKKPSLIVRLRINPVALAKATGKTQIQKRKWNDRDEGRAFKRTRRTHAPISYAEEDEDDSDNGGHIRRDYPARSRRSSAPAISYTEVDTDHDDTDNDEEDESVPSTPTKLKNTRLRNTVEVVYREKENTGDDLGFLPETALNSSRSPTASQETPLTTPPWSSPAKTLDHPSMLSEAPHRDDGRPHPDIPCDKNKRMCTCRLPEEGRSMLKCQAKPACYGKTWYHADCVGWSSKEIVSIVSFICPTCDKKGLGRTLTKAMRMEHQRLGKKLEYAEVGTVRFL